MTTIISARPERAARYLNPLALARALWRRRDLIRQFTRREIVGRYKGSFLGLFWSFANPLVLLLTYTLVFGLIFRPRWPDAGDGSLGSFALVIFCGLIAFNIFSESVTRAASLITSVPNYVKKVVFPLEILPVSLLGSALFHALASLLILLIANLLLTGTLHWTLVALPLVALPLIFLSLGLAWFLASLGVFIRDTNYAVAPLVQVLFFATPIFYPLEAIPPRLRPIIALNPLTVIAENFRRVILWGTLPDWPALAIWLLVTGVLMLAGYAWFMRTRPAFADVI